MFTIYKKIISPETSPVLGPATPRESQTVQSPSIQSQKITPMESQTTQSYSAQSYSAQSLSAQSLSADIQSPKMQSMPTPMDPFSLCDCCSTRTKPPAQPAQPAQSEKTDPEPIFEFNHATHYRYNATTPRMVWEFDINIKPTPKH